MFTKWVSQTGRKLYEKKYDGQLIVIVHKHHVWLSEEITKVFQNPERYCVLSNEKEWAIKPAEELEEGSYLASNKSHANEERNVIRPTAFITANEIPIGYIYKGKLQDGMIIFNKKPAEKA